MMSYKMHTVHAYFKAVIDTEEVQAWSGLEEHGKMARLRKMASCAHMQSALVRFWFFLLPSDASHLGFSLYACI